MYIINSRKFEEEQISFPIRNICEARLRILAIILSIFGRIYHLIHNIMTNKKPNCYDNKMLSHSRETESNRRPKDVNLTTTVLRSTN